MFSDDKVLVNLTKNAEASLKKGLFLPRPGKEKSPALRRLALHLRSMQDNPVKDSIFEHVRVAAAASRVTQAAKAAEMFIVASSNKNLKYLVQSIEQVLTDGSWDNSDALEKLATYLDCSTPQESKIRKHIAKSVLSIAARSPIPGAMKAAAKARLLPVKEDICESLVNFEIMFFLDKNQALCMMEFLEEEIEFIRTHPDSYLARNWRSWCSSNHQIVKMLEAFGINVTVNKTADTENENTSSLGDKSPNTLIAAASAFFA